MIQPESIEQFGDRGILVKFDRRPSGKLTQHLVELCRAARGFDGVIDAVPGHRTVLIEIDPTRHEAIKETLQSFSFDAHPVKGRLHSIAVSYDGPDVDWACDHLQIDHDELVRLHSKEIYDVRTLGSPKFVYLSAVPREISLPRLDDPRVEVPPGSVGIGGRQTGIYALSRPGGWRLIAKVQSEIPDLAASDRVEFVPE